MTISEGVVQLQDASLELRKPFPLYEMAHARGTVSVRVILLDTPAIITHLCTKTLRKKNGCRVAIARRRGCSFSSNRHEQTNGRSVEAEKYQAIHFDRAVVVGWMPV